MNNYYSSYGNSITFIFKKISFSTWINDLGAFVGNAVNFCQTDKQDTTSIKWQSETCAVDVSMCGLWSTKLARDSDIHCVAVNPERSLVAVGDSRGQISLFRYPCFKQGVSDDKLVKKNLLLNIYWLLFSLINIWIPS